MEMKRTVTGVRNSRVSFNGQRMERNGSRTRHLHEFSRERRLAMDGNGTGRHVQRERGPNPLNYKALEKVCNSNSTDEGILDLFNKAKRFEDLLDQSTGTIRPDLMKLVIRAIHMCCLPNDKKEIANKLLRTVIKTNFLPLHLTKFISQMSDVSAFGDNYQPDELVLLLAEVFLELLQRFEQDVVHFIPNAQLSETVGDLKSRGLLQDAEMLERKLQQVKEYKNDINRRKKIHQDQSQLTPPEDFRQISVIPQAADLRPYSKPFLRENVVDGKYLNQEHYLDVQFRLLREDFILPLRNGIEQLQKSHSPGASKVSHSKRVRSVRVYHDVTIMYPVCSGKGMVYRIRFNSSHPDVVRVRWEKSKLFKLGSLLCLSSDKFRSLLFATVENRDSRDLCVGELEVRFEDVQFENLNRFIEEKEKFDMVESPAFFQAYRHVLEGLQEIEPGGLPFEEHIVQCNQDVKPPEYENKTSGFFHMSGMIGEDVDSTASQPSAGGDSSEDFVNIYDLELSPEDLGFNKSQMSAFKMALTKKFAVIQGPPGTGKTYVGRKIARVLLQSAPLWQKDSEPSPILMVSYTNHALDDFLAELPSEGVVRVGGRCSEKLESCSLKARRNEAADNKQTPFPIYSARKRAQEEIKELNDEGSLDLCIAVLKCSRRGILAFDILKKFMMFRHVKWFHKLRTDNDCLLCEWLGLHYNGERNNTKNNDYDVKMERVFQTQESARNFEDNEEEREIQPSKVAISTIEDIEKPVWLRSHLLREEVISEEKSNIYNLSRLPQFERWNLYRLWLQKAEKYYMRKLQSKQPDYERALARKFEVMLEEDFHVLQSAKIIGMTTTCAAKYRRTLQRIRPKIVIVEEAAEVLEAHIITSLTKDCQHLILIGDHKQLRPKPEVYALAKKYHLDVSLFERMVNVGLQCETLNVQHRMRPEIAALMKHIYDDLENHKTVEGYWNIKGLKKNMFFINHSHLENPCEDSYSHVNDHEAKFLVALCRYLLQQGYKPHQITLLTTYTGQMFAIRDCVQAKQRDDLSQVRLTTVDNFQGEENDIILLSLVRSNKEDEAGFIKMENRACVALSRAREGFYCIGNFALLCKHSEIWNKIVDDLKASSSFGASLILICQSHKKEITAETAEDFEEKAPEGGCQRPCEVRLQCGHVCKRSCHPNDVDHLEYQCGEPCVKKILGCEHTCSKLCWQKCDTYCQVVVEKALPSCKHVTTVKCGKDLKKVQCQVPCDKKLSCSHRCQSYCSKPCTTECQELVERKDWPCGHEVKVACSATPSDCPAPCVATLECGHQCPGKCSACRMGRVHVRCKLKCSRVLVCSHVCRAGCTKSCPPCTFTCQNCCKHSKCELQCGVACKPCAQKCNWKCPHFECSKLCGELCDRPRCDRPCKKFLKCARGKKRRPHRCRGLCGEQCICAVCMNNDGDPITQIFLGREDEVGARFIQLPDCKHIFAVKDLDYYMDMPNNSEDNRHVIQLKTCPRCKTAIRRSLRYGNVIKQQLLDIEKVKAKVNGNQIEIETTKKDLEERLENLLANFATEVVKKEWNALMKRVNKISNSLVAAVVTNQVMLMERFLEINRKLKAKRLHNKIQSEGLTFQEELEYLKRRAMSETVTERELCDINVECTRINLRFELCLLKRSISKFSLTLMESHGNLLKDVQDELSSGKLIQTQRLDELQEMLSGIRKAYPCLSPLTPEERQEIVSAMGFKQGHWFKCPNGHPYTIGECGGAMEKSTCNECGAVIGGAQHRLEDGNQLAPEMDGARHAAWSEQANMENYMVVDEA